MSNSITVGIPQAPDDSPTQAAVEHSKHVNVRIGDQSNIANVDGRMGVKHDPRPDDLPVVGDTVETTKGTASVVRSITGKTLVNLPGGTQITLAEAKAAGLLVDPQAAPRADESETKVTPQVDQKPDEGEKADGGQDDGGNDGAESLPTVNKAELESHAREINAVGEAFEAAGINPEQALDQAVASVLKTGELDETLSGALIDRFGEETSQGLLANAQHHVEAHVADAVTAAGVDLNDLATDPTRVAELDKALDAALAHRPQAIVAALRGDATELRHIVTNVVRSPQR